MKKPKTFKELYKIVNLQDLLDVVDFSGINDHRNEEHSKIRRKLQNDLYNSLNYAILDVVGYYRKQPHFLNREMEDIDYIIIIESLQDFYYWGHQFSHIYSHIYQRVQNALEIPIEEITPIMDERIRDCTKCDFYGECDHQGAYKKDGKWCYEDSQCDEAIK